MQELWPLPSYFIDDKVKEMVVNLWTDAVEILEGNFFIKNPAAINPKDVSP